MAHNSEPYLSLGPMGHLFNPDYPLCREDVLWVLEFMKKKVADEASELLSLPQPQLLRIFQCFSEASMIMIKQRGGSGTETERLRSCLIEGILGLYPSSAT
ncbi:hypothetical protein [Paenibacillus nasutitermitis]|uniref:Uncharacterized protein n=1 Tax=Paenibacillus nasutitermitis TaxID=1652958 RepID=A0A917DTK4_9BACL|nr:hypothetical protein [Paenibacillus nasutitermitis]GGD65381.1 hypothetical protein GCM10010911_23970 [Paenibacillus nasutitermitis]